MHVINKADTTWLLISSALVLLMTPGLALFYGGMVRSKNAVNTLMMSFVCMGIVTIEWIILGYSLSFGSGLGGFLGGLNHIFLNGVTSNPSKDYAVTVPEYAFVTFQMMFAIITPALISGALVERMKFSAYILFILLWSIFVYNPICHWVWAKDGWLYKLGALDFAGGTVVHINAGISALVAAFVLGRRKGFMREQILPHNVVLTALGTGLLWFGWFGFNAGSALAINGVAVNAFITTNTSGAIAAFTWMVLEWLKEGKPTLLGIASGAIAGLAGITPASGFVNFWGALIIGFFAAIFGFYAITWLKAKLKYDDSLDVFGVHGIDGMWGTLAAGLFADPAINGKAGLFYGNPSLFVKQLIGVVVVVIATIIGTVILAYIAKLIAGNWRVPEDVEVEGLDQAFHGERAFDI